MTYAPIADPRVTAVIPVYNEEACLEACIDSLRRQDFKSIEIIVVDDGSTDASRDICRSLGVRLLTQLHKGPGAARNAGAFAAKGDILVFADADMTFDRSYISKLLAPIVSGAAKASCHWNELVANWENPWARCRNWYMGIPDMRRQPLEMPKRETVYRAVRKDFFISSGGFDEKEGRGEDSAVSRRTGVLAVITPDAICYHRNATGPGEIFGEALWAGRSLVFEPENRLKRSLAAVLVHHNPLIDVLRGIQIALAKKEFRVVIYSAVYSTGFVIGVAQALFTGFYNK